MSAEEERAAVLEMADHPSRAFKVQTIVFREHTRDTSVRLKRGERLFIIHDGQTPIDTDCYGPDEILVMTEKFGTWPVVAVKVRLAHVDSWRKVTTEDAGRMMARVRAHLSALDQEGGAK